MQVYQGELWRIGTEFHYEIYHFLSSFHGEQLCILLSQLYLVCQNRLIYHDRKDMYLDSFCVPDDPLSLQNLSVKS